MSVEAVITLTVVGLMLAALVLELYTPDFQKRPLSVFPTAEC
jgi:hypothetical protein